MAKEMAPIVKYTCLFSMGYKSKCLHRVLFSSIRNENADLNNTGNCSSRLRQANGETIVAFTKFSIGEYVCVGVCSCVCFTSKQKRSLFHFTQQIYVDLPTPILCRATHIFAHVDKSIDMGTHFYRKSVHCPFKDR